MVLLTAAEEACCSASANGHARTATNSIPTAPSWFDVDIAGYGTSPQQPAALRAR